MKHFHPYPLLYQHIGMNKVFILFVCRRKILGVGTPSQGVLGEVSFLPVQEDVRAGVSF